MNATARGLGRGLEALIPSTDAVYRELQLSQIVVNPHQPRRHFDASALEYLADSIKAVGVLQPIVVRRAATVDRFEIIAGERRWRAAQQAGITVIPAVINDSGDEASLVNAVIENTHREDLNALEESAAYRQLIDDFGLTHAEVAERLGKSRPAITNALRLLSLPSVVQQMVLENTLTAGHARALLGTDDEDLQRTLAEQAVEQDWSVREVEAAVRATHHIADGHSEGNADAGPTGQRQAKTAVKTDKRFAALLEVEAQLSDLLATEVSVELRSKVGEVRIRFADMDDLTRICAILRLSET